MRDSHSSLKESLKVSLKTYVKRLQGISRYFKRRRWLARHYIFQKSGQKEDARAVIRHLDSLAGKYPTVLGLVAKLEKLVAGHG